MQPLAGTRVITLALNLPGPLAVAKLRQMGAEVAKIEPPAGDPLSYSTAEWYRELHTGIDVLQLDLKQPDGGQRLSQLLARADLLVTATRPAALERLGLAWAALHNAHPRLSQVAVVGYPAPEDNLPGHDLTYQARLGLLDPPALPRALIADWAGSEAVVSAALSLILARERGQGTHYVEVSLCAAAAYFALPLQRGLTKAGGLLGGGFPGYNVYETKSGWISVAALEPHFWMKLQQELGLASPNSEEVQTAFRGRTAAEWEEWALARDLPVAALRA